MDDPIDRADQPLAVLCREPEPRLEQVPPDRPHPRRRGRWLVVQARQHRLQALTGLIVVLRADEHEDLLALAPDQPCERVHSQKARGTGQEDRAPGMAHLAGGTHVAAGGGGEGQPIA